MIIEWTTAMQAVFTQLENCAKYKPLTQPQIFWKKGAKISEKVLKMDIDDEESAWGDKKTQELLMPPLRSLSGKWGLRHTVGRSGKNSVGKRQGKTTVDREKKKL